MSSLPERLSITALLQKYGLRPDKSLGQNFLTDPAILERIVTIAGVTREDTVLEIGAGLGHLSVQLARCAGRLLAVELDRRLIKPLEDALRPYPNTSIVQGDILQLDPADLMESGGYLVVANIPYYITSRIIRHLLESPLKPGRIILTIQHEVAQRICAGKGDLSLLALSVLIYGEPSLELKIPAGAFYPEPQVDSAVVLIKIHTQPMLTDSLREIFFKLIKAGFKHKRKTLRNSLLKSLGWPGDRVSELLVDGGIDPRRRAETLSLEEWLILVRQYDKMVFHK
jgi:16S rRNA (adenine1518-N6/adenine1519-N6)-dimethyltransferase